MVSPNEFRPGNGPQWGRHERWPRRDVFSSTRTAPSPLTISMSRAGQSSALDATSLSRRVRTVRSAAPALGLLQRARVRDRRRTAALRHPRAILKQASLNPHRLEPDSRCLV